jgi:phage tail-like protein
MDTLRPFALVRTTDQWLRAAHVRTALDTRHGVVELAPRSLPPTDAGALAAPPNGAGLAFDRECRLYHSVPGDVPRGGRLEWALWTARGRPAAGPSPAQPLDLFAAGAQDAFGDFAPAVTPRPALDDPRGIAVDADDRLFVAEAGGRSILVVDLWSRRLLRAVTVAASDGTAARPLDVAVHGSTVYAVTAPVGLVRFTAHGEPRWIELPPGLRAPLRLAVSPGGRILVLEGAGRALARVVPLDRPDEAFVVYSATDLEFDGDDVLVVARDAGADFRRYRLGPGTRSTLPPLAARGYDGRGIVRTPDARIAFWTDRGLRHALPARVTYQPDGQVTTFRLDSGAFQTVWGRLFIDACIPEGTDVRVHCLTLDEPLDEAAVPRTPPSTVEQAVIVRPDLSPPMPPISLVPSEDAVRHPLHRRDQGRELPWTPMALGDPFVTYEAPVLAPPGRYLWVTLALRGQDHATPRIRCLRAEYPSHDYLRRLPRAFSRDPEVADFLRRYLAIFEGVLGDLEARAAERHRLLDPWSAPEDALPWLASFLGLVLDERWREASRALIDEAIWLFRFRGTVPGLTRFLELYLGRPVNILEHFRLRGTGGALLGGEAPVFSSAVVGGGFRVGGAVGERTATPLSGSVDDAFATHAHRFTVIVQAALTAEQEGAVRHILEMHRPAHTVFELCTVDAGTRVGQGLLVGLASMIGRSGGFTPLRLGDGALGRGAVLGRPQVGTHPGASRLGGDSRVG